METTDRRLKVPRWATAALALVVLGALTPATAAQQSTAQTGPEYRFPLSCSKFAYSHVHHDYPATDIFAKAGCPFVAPVDGVVDEVSRKDRWNPRTDRGADRGGRFVSIVGVDGVRYYGSHLRMVQAGIEPGVAVTAGQALGKVGNSGSARYTASHLHFGISRPTDPGNWKVRRGEIWPAPYLDAWRDGRDKSPAAKVRATPTR